MCGLEWCVCVVYSGVLLCMISNCGEALTCGGNVCVYIYYTIVYHTSVRRGGADVCWQYKSANLPHYCVPH